MQFRQIQIRQVEFYELRKPLVKPPLRIIGKPLTVRESVYAKVRPIIPVKQNLFVKHCNQSIINETKLLRSISQRPLHETAYRLGKILISNSNVSKKQKYATKTSTYKFGLQPVFTNKSSVAGSSSKTNVVSSKTNVVSSKKLPIVFKNTGKDKTMSSKSSHVTSKAPTRINSTVNIPNHKTSSINNTYSSQKQHKSKSIVGNKANKQIPFGKTNNNSSTITVKICNDLESMHTIPNAASTTVHGCTKSQGQSKVHIRRYLRLVCLVPSANKSIQNPNDYIPLLELDMDPNDMFTDSKKCIHFLKEKSDETIFLIMSNDIGQSIIHDVHHLFQVKAIYILGDAKCKDKRWIKNWINIRNIYASIRSICEVLKHDIQRHHRDSMAISMSSVELDHVDRSFMYTKLLTEILLEMGYDNRATEAFTQFCRQHLNTEKSHNPRVIDEFEQDYDPDKTIWWYTRDCFLFEIINKALREQTFHIIIKAGFFIRDLQKKIEMLHKPPTEKIIVYRGQGLSQTDFEQLCLRCGGLHCFNNFLSTTMDYARAYLYAASNKEKPEQIGVLFQIEIEPDIFTPTQWASIGIESYFSDEEEILFAMHSIFRIGEIKKIENRLWKVQLLLTSDHDVELMKITEFIQQATQGSSGWDRLGKLLLKLGKFHQAEEIFLMLIKNTSEDDEHSRGHRYQMLGLIYEQGKSDYIEALYYYKKALKIYLQNPDSNDLDLITIYNSIGEMHREAKDYSKALEYFQMALNIQKHQRCAYDVALSVIYNNMAETYKCLKQYKKAMNFYKTVLSIQKKAVPLNFTNLGATYSNIAIIYRLMEDYQKSLALFRKVARIHQNNLSFNKADAAVIDNNIGKVYEALKQYTIALAYYEKALGVISQFHSFNVAEFTNTHDNIARIYKNMNENMKALEHFRLVAYYLRKHPNLKRPNLGIVCDSMGQLYKSMQETRKAVVCYRKAIQFEENRKYPDDSKLRFYRTHLAEVKTQ